jgi:hypothetical protein
MVPVVKKRSNVTAGISGSENQNEYCRICSPGPRKYSLAIKNDYQYKKRMGSLHGAARISCWRTDACAYKIITLICPSPAISVTIGEGGAL